jgi:hypothetical protein
VSAAARGLRFCAQHGAVDVLARGGPREQVGVSGAGFLDDVEPTPWPTGPATDWRIAVACSRSLMSLRATAGSVAAREVGGWSTKRGSGLVPLKPDLKLLREQATWTHPPLNRRVEGRRWSVAAPVSPDLAMIAFLR